MLGGLLLAALTIDDALHSASALTAQKKQFPLVTALSTALSNPLGQTPTQIPLPIGMPPIPVPIVAAPPQPPPPGAPPPFMPFPMSTSSPSQSKLQMNMPMPMMQSLETAPLVMPGQESIDTTPCKQQEFDSKVYNVTVFGASGGLGKRAAMFISRTIQPNMTWAIAGRSKNLLEYFRGADLGAKGVGVGLVTADLKDISKLNDLASKSHVILSFAGPYEANGGQALIRAALQNCAHYVDVSAETKWKRGMMDMFSATAAARGLAIVHSAGFEATASDVLAASAVEDFVAATGAPPTNLTILWSKMNFLESSAYARMQNWAMAHHGFVRDPYVLSPETPAQVRVDTTIDGAINYGFNQDFDIAINPHPSARIEAPVIRRSMHSLFPHAPIRIQEFETEDLQKLLVEYRNSVGGEVQKLSTDSEHETQYSLDEQGSFAGEAIASHCSPFDKPGDPIPFVRVAIEGNGDPYSIAAAKMAATVALGLAEIGLKDGGGSLTPSMVLGPAELERRLLAVDGGRFLQITHGQ